MRRFTKKQYLVAGVAAAIIAGTAGTALAYWTAGGAGTGTGTTGTSSNVTLHASFTNNTLSPGNSVPVSYTADNATSSAVQVGTVHAVVTASGTCDPSWFSVADVAENQTIAANGAAVPLTNAGSLVFTESGTNQDVCKGATITLTLSS
jgi:hypothetical protein